MAKKRSTRTRAPRAASPKDSPSHTKRYAAKRANLVASPVQRTLAKVRDLCLALPETAEVEAWGHPTFRVNDKIFAGFGVEEGVASLGVKTTPDHQARLVADPRFTIAPYVGKHGWVNMRLDGEVDWVEVQDLVRGSYDLIAPARLSRMGAEKPPPLPKKR